MLKAAVNQQTTNHHNWQRIVVPIRKVSRKGGVTGVKGQAGAVNNRQRLNGRHTMLAGQGKEGRGGRVKVKVGSGTGTARRTSTNQ